MDKANSELEQFVNKANKEKKQRRKSSISSESIKLLQNQKENVNDLILKVVDSQLDWLNHQLDRLNKRMSKSKKRVEKTSAVLYALELDVGTSSTNETEPEMSILSKEQQDFLKATDIDFDTVYKHLKKIRQHEIKKQIELYNNDSARSDLSKHSFLSNSMSRLSISASCSAQSKQEKKDIFEILNEYFDDGKENK